MSTVSIELVLDALAGPIEVGGGRPEGTVRQAVEALVGTLRFLGDGLIWVVVCGLVLGLVWMWRGRRG